MLGLHGRHNVTPQTSRRLAAWGKVVGCPDAGLNVQCEASPELEGIQTAGNCNG